MSTTPGELGDALKLAPAPVVPPQATANQPRAPVLPPAAPAAESVRRDWRDIEPFLKWAAVAYAFGFLTVMVHTARRLGVPVVQLIEPVNVLIGFPLACVVFFLDHLVKAARNATKEFLRHAAEAREIEQELQDASGDPVVLFTRMMDVMASVYALLLSPVLGVRLARFATTKLLWAYVKVVEKWSNRDFIAEIQEVNRKATPQERKAFTSSFVPKMARMLRFGFWQGSLTHAAAAFLRILAIPAACAAYIWLAFPLIPQSLGGGKPISVQLLISTESLPRDPVFRDWLPAREEKAAGKDSKETVVVEVTLHLRTEHELLVQRGNGPMIALSEHAVEGIVYQAH